MLARFRLYSFFKNFRLFEHFFVVFLLAPAIQGGAGLSYLAIGSLLGYQKVLTALLEVPSGFVADQWGRRRSLMICFGTYLVAFPLYVLAAGYADSRQLALLYVAQTLFAIGEAFRTGTHKAIMLDWVDSTEPDAGVRVIGGTRMVSKITAGVSALLGSFILAFYGRFAALFWVSAAAAFGGLVLMTTYPAWLDGEARRKRVAGVKNITPFSGLRLQRGFASLIAQSVALEAGIKVAQHYVQPLLYRGLEASDLRVVGGTGALVIGVYYLVHEGLGGLASGFSSSVDRRLSGPRVLRLAPVAALAAISLAAVGLWLEFYPLALIAFIALGILQNGRRPIFVSELNQVMDKEKRATVLSAESQLRSLAFGVLAPATGYVADAYGLAAALAAMSLVMVVALSIPSVPDQRP